MLWLGILLFVIVNLWYWGDKAMGTIWASLNQKPHLRPIAWIILAPGVITHETSHALAALATGAGVEKFVPFHPVKTEDGGWQFGYVQPKRGSIWTDGIVAMAPLWLAPLLLYGVGTWLTGHSGLDFWKNLPFANPLLYLWFYWLISISLSNMPSRTDFRVAAPFLALAGVVFAFALAAVFLGKLQIESKEICLTILVLLLPQTIAAIGLSLLAQKR